MVFEAFFPLYVLEEWNGGRRELFGLLYEG